MPTENEYSKAIRMKLADLTRLAESTLTLSRVVSVLAPLEASCARSRCMGAETCSHLRVDVLALGKRIGHTEEAPFTARFRPGDDPGEPVIFQGWLE